MHLTQKKGEKVFEELIQRMSWDNFIKSKLRSEILKLLKS
jgi:hypothetical protein